MAIDLTRPRATAADPAHQAAPLAAAVALARPAAWSAPASRAGAGA